jgi:DNA modification methylase
MGYELTKEIVDEVNHIDGFPIGKVEDIIALSDPPYYTSCPNPWLEDFIKEYGKPFHGNVDNGYHKEPFAFDVSEGKNDPIYNAHSYHTKVPYKAIMRYILHYTEPGDIVFDGFCGTGMTGIAAQMCGTPDMKFSTLLKKEMPNVKWGKRKAILCDLSPAATFIAYNYNIPVNSEEFQKEARRILSEVERECGWMYETTHTINGKTQYTKDINDEEKPIKGKVNYTVWSDVFVCPNCTKEVIFWNAAVDKEKNEIKEQFNCPHCDTLVSKLTLERAWETLLMDDGPMHSIRVSKRIPVLINYSILLNGKNKRYEKSPDSYDFDLIKRIEQTKIHYWYPSDPMMFKGISWGDTWRAGIHAGITHVHHFFTKRALLALSTAFYKILSVNQTLRLYMTYTFEQAILGMAKLARYAPTHYSQVNRYISGTLYIGSQTVDVSIAYILENKINRLAKVLSSIKDFSKEDIRITTQSNSSFPQIPPNSVDYIFTDPPFGSNLMYAELNFLWEAWLKVFTNPKHEAVMNKSQRKFLQDYQLIMEQCFKENYRIIKPGRWMTVEFHNSQNSVWLAIQEALMKAGFIIADVRTLDKEKGKQGSFKQVTSTNAVKRDLVIFAYKPAQRLEKNFSLTAGAIEGVWDFIEEHLKHLPIFVEKEGIAEIIMERQKYLLFDRMVAFHVQRGISVPISASDFYECIRQRFDERDNMYFLPEQAQEYDNKRALVKSVGQLSLFVYDEKSAIQWLRQQLEENQQTYQDLQPKFVKELHQLRYEKLPELSVLLEQNFLKNKENRWYVPDPSKQSDLERLREKLLLREFEEYRRSKGKLKMFRIEAVRAGFKYCWSNQDYKTITEVCKHLPNVLLHEDSTLLLYYDNASTRARES